jgi:hypothetical protein
MKRLNNKMIRMANEQYLDGLIQHLKKYPKMELQYIYYAQKKLQLCENATNSLYLFAKEEYKNPMFYEGFKEEASQDVQDILDSTTELAPIEIIQRKLCEELNWIANQIKLATNETKHELYELATEKLNEVKTKLNYFLDNINQITEEEQTNLMMETINDIENNQSINYKPYRNGLTSV